MGFMSIWHWVILLVVVVLIFGTKKLRNLGSDLGGAVKGFKEGMREGDEPHTEAAKVTDPTLVKRDATIDIEAKEKV